MSRTKIRIGLGLALGFALSPLLAGQPQNPKAADKNQLYKGNVVPLEKLLAKQNVKIDPDAAPYAMVLQTEDGKVHPIVKDGGARMFFKDARLLNRPMALTARPVANGAFLQVVNVQSFVKGRLCDVYYWCDICTIRSHENGPCACCLAPVELREVPVK